MRFSLYNQFGAKNSASVFEAIARGLQRHGHDVVYHDDSADVAIIWSQLWWGRMQPNHKIWTMYQQSNRPVLIAEVGAINRGQTWKLMFNGQNQFIVTGNTDARSRQLGMQTMPWQRQGYEILVALQHTNSNQWKGLPPVYDWLLQTVTTLRKHTDRPIVVRPHPRQKINQVPLDCVLQTPRAVVNTYDSFDIGCAIQRSWAVINWNSNPGIDAVLAGVPAFVGSTSIAAPVSNLDLAQIETPQMPDRTQWVNDLAWTEWTIAELENGLALDPVLFLIHRTQCSIDPRKH